MDVLKVSIIGIMAVMSAIAFKGIKNEYGIYISIVAGIIIFGCLLDKLKGIISTINDIQNYATVNDTYIIILIKVIGITYIGEFSAGICRDSGYNALAGQIEVFTKITIMTLSIPVIMSLIECINGILS